MKGEKNHKDKDVWILMAVLALTIGAVSQILKLQIDNSVKVFIPKNNPVKIINDDIEEEFGSMDTLIMGVEARFGTIIDPDYLSVVDGITREIESLAEVDQVISPTNVDYIGPSPGGMEVIPLLESPSSEGMSQFRTRLIDWQEMYVNTVISRDDKMAALIIRPRENSSAEEKLHIYQVMKDLSRRYAHPNLSFPMAGEPVLNAEVSRSIFKDLLFLIPLAALAILGILYISFRRWEGVLFPMITLAITCLWVMGLMGFLGLDFTMASLLIPVLLLVVCSAYGIHLMTHFYEILKAQEGWVSPDRLNRLFLGEVRIIRLSLLMAGATTAGGFVSQITSPLIPFRIFGLICGAGILFSLVLTFLLIPILLRMRYPRGIEAEHFHRKTDIIERGGTPKLFLHFLRIVRRGRIPLIALSLILLVSTLFLIPRIHLGTNLIDFFTPENQMVRDSRRFIEKMSGTGIISLVISAPERGDILSPGFLTQLEDFENWLPRKEPHITKIRTIVPVVKRMNRIMNYDTIPYQSPSPEATTLDFFSDQGLWEKESPPGDDAGQDPTHSAEEAEFPPVFTSRTLAELFSAALDTTGISPSARDLVHSLLVNTNYRGAAFDEIPREPEKYGFNGVRELHALISQYMVLYSGSMNSMLNDPLEPDKILITLHTGNETAAEITRIISTLSDYWDYFLPKEWGYQVGGPSTLNAVLTSLVGRSQLISLGTALLIVWIILTLLFRSLKIGTIGMIPVLFALIGIFIFMVLFQFNLDIVTSLLAALAVGIGVDYAIHFIKAYLRHQQQGGVNILERVYRTTGRAILLNASSVALGFLTLLFSRFIPIRQMGILFAVSMVFAGLSSLIVLPMALEGAIKPPLEEDPKCEKLLTQV